MSADHEHGPIAFAAADAAFGVLRSFKTLLLAVSGGPDSLALLVLAADWCKHLGAAAPNIFVATVDHGLREGSAREAEIVGQIAASFGVRHTTLHWLGGKPAAGIPNAARNARYALLDDYAKSFAVDGSVAVVTAHHQDDQAETVLMRLARGGGVDALAAMRCERPLIEGSPVRLLRPLLGFSKARLVATLNDVGTGWLDDPTNSDTKFERTRVRAALDASGLGAAALATTARRMADASEGIDYAVARFIETLDLSTNSGIFASLDRRAFDAGPAIVRQSVFAQLIGYFGGATPKPDLSEIEGLAGRVLRSTGAAVTLGGAVISPDLRTIRVWREPGRLSVPEMVLTPGQHQLWDDRFWVGCDGDPGTIVTVKPLGQAAYETISSSIPPTLCPPASAAYGLPAFWSEAALLAVPLLSVITEPGLRLREARLSVIQYRPPRSYER